MNDRLNDRQGDCGIVALVIDLLDDATTPSRATCGLPTPFFPFFRLVHKLGHLDRGGSIELDAAECQLLDDILKAACELERAGKLPMRSDEVIAAMIKRVAYENVDPSEWARNLPRAILGNRIWKVDRH